MWINWLQNCANGSQHGRRLALRGGWHYGAAGSTGRLALRGGWHYGAAGTRSGCAISVCRHCTHICLDSLLCNSLKAH